MNYDRLEPFDEERADRRAALICMVLANVNRRQGAPPFGVSDFLIDYDKLAEEYEQGPKRQSVEEIKNLLMSLVEKPKKKPDKSPPKRTRRKKRGR